MRLAKIPLPRKIRIPEYIRKASLGTLIDVYGHELLYNADNWITTRHAWPHEDSHYFGGLYFLTLSVQSSHQIGDVYSPEPNLDVPRGTLFVIDPLVVHWLMPNDPEQRRPRGWIGLQWEVPRKDVVTYTRNLVRELGGTWFSPIEDKRYAKWKP